MMLENDFNLLLEHIAKGNCPPVLGSKMSDQQFRLAYTTLENAAAKEKDPGKKYKMLAWLSTQLPLMRIVPSSDVTRIRAHAEGKQDPFK